MKKNITLDLSALDRKIEILEYNESYPKIFGLEKNRIVGMLDKKIDAIEHVGSTSVYGLIGKPTIDILIRLNSQVRLDESILLFESVNYKFIPELLNYRPDRRIFWKGARNRHDFHIHVVSSDSKEWSRVIKFRDRLREDHDSREEYANLKLELSRKHKTSIADYVLGKDEFYSRVVDE